MLRATSRRSPALVSLALLGCLLTQAAPSEAALPSKATWLHDVHLAMRPAIPWLDRRVARGGSRLAIVLDIDNTAIATHYAWPRPVRRTLAFAAAAHALGVSVRFVTGRYRRDARAQRPVLVRAGYVVDGICGRRLGEPLAEGKARCRTRLAGEGYTIIAVVGNLPSDFTGGHVGRRFDLPDYHRQLS